MPLTPTDMMFAAVIALNAYSIVVYPSAILLLFEMKLWAVTLFGSRLRVFGMEDSTFNAYRLGIIVLDPRRS